MVSKQMRNDSMSSDA